MAMTKQEREQRARDPNIEPSELARLLPLYPEEALANPALPLIVLEDAGFMRDIPRDGMRVLLIHPDLPTYLLSVLATHPDKKIVDEVMMHASWREAVTGWEREAASRIAQLPTLTSEKQRFSDKGLFPSWLYNALPAKKRPTPTKIEGEAESTQGYKLPLSQFLERQIGNSFTRNAAQITFLCVLHFDDGARIQKAAQYATWYSRFAVSLNIHATRDTLEKLAGDGNRYVRAAARARLADPNWRFED
jgi:hypothetical protein